MFVEMKDLPPVGSIVKFQVEIGEPTQTVSGTAEVVWIRTQARPKEPVGVGLQFRFIEKNGAPALSAAVHKVLARAGTRAGAGPTGQEKPRRLARLVPNRHPKRDEKSSKKKQAADDSKQILGMPAEKAKMILLLVLMAFLLLVFLL